VSTSKPVDLAPDAAPVASDTGMRAIPYAGLLYTLVRRELWEHRVVWLAPLAVALLLVLSATFTSPGLTTFNFSVDGQPGLVSLLGNGSPRLSLAVFGMIHWGMSLPLYLLLALIATFYLSDCLYAERRDRSILFWKSLPVSDLTTVVSKALVGMVLLPFGVYLLAVVTDALFSGAWHIRSLVLGSGPSFVPWNTLAWLKVQALLGIGVLLSVLWLAPWGGYFLVVSAWARRNAVLWASVPPLLAPLIEHQAFGTAYIWQLLTYRTSGLWDLPGLAAARQSASVPLPHFSLLSPAELFDALPLASLFTNIHLWLGLLVALGLGYLASRIRRYRDES
jgi:ABC-2 type transport system permease protein